MSTFSLVNRDRHGHQTYCPPSQDSSNENHSEILSSALKYRSNQVYESTHHDRFPAAESVHRESSPSIRQYMSGTLRKAVLLHHRTKERSA